MLVYTRQINQLRMECTYAWPNSTYRNRLSDTVRQIFDRILGRLERIPNPIRNDLFAEATIMVTLKEGITNARSLLGIPNYVKLAVGAEEANEISQENVRGSTHRFNRLTGGHSLAWFISHSAHMADTKNLLSVVLCLTTELYKELFEESRLRYRRFIVALWNEDDHNFQNLYNAITFPVEEGDNNGTYENAAN
jgi:hypothetical protein